MIARIARPILFTYRDLLLQINESYFVYFCIIVEIRRISQSCETRRAEVLEYRDVELCFRHVLRTIRK